MRPGVPCHYIREHYHTFGAVEPLTGDNFFLVLPQCNAVCMNVFLRDLSKEDPDDIIFLCCNGAAWHTSGALEILENIPSDFALHPIC